MQTITDANRIHTKNNMSSIGPPTPSDPMGVKGMGVKGCIKMSHRILLFKGYRVYHLKHGPRLTKNCHPGFANNKGADQPAHSHSLISAFVICF